MKQLITECEPDENGRLILGGKSYTYLAKVRRMREGDVLTVLLPITGATQMKIEKISPKNEILLVKVPYRTKKEQRECAATITLLQWVLKGSKTDDIIRQATEAGVQTIMPVIGEFSVAKKQNPAQIDRFRRIIKEARQQSGSPIDTAIMPPLPLTAALETLIPTLSATSAVLGMCCEVDSTSTSLHKLLAAKPAHIVLAIGAEGGISPAETALLRNSGFHPIHFQTNVLRAETAALYAVAAVQTIINEADQWQLPE